MLFARWSVRPDHTPTPAGSDLTIWISGHCRKRDERAARIPGFMLWLDRYFLPDKLRGARLKSPAVSQSAREGQGTRGLHVVKA